jgi:hypothetical protein
MTEGAALDQIERSHYATYPPTTLMASSLRQARPSLHKFHFLLSTNFSTLFELDQENHKISPKKEQPGNRHLTIFTFPFFTAL